jgi:hypothetical protein
MAALTLSNPTGAGTVEAYQNANAGGDSFPIPGPLVIKMKNASGANRTVTLVGQKQCNQGFTHSVAIGPIATGTTVDVAVNDRDRFADVNGKIQMTYDNEAGLSFAAYSR